MKEVRPQQLILDPYESSGDLLYSIYRKGLITRHITNNGRLLEKVALEKIGASGAPDSDEHLLAILEKGPCYGKSPLSLDNLRHSVEEDPVHNTMQKYTWAPVIAPIKYPGPGNDFFCAVSGGGDNALYYGGIALAFFSLEAKYRVSDVSIQYARRLVHYFLSSEMTGRNGYLLKRPSFYDSERNPSGEPIVQGAGPEDLLGVMMGLMYYLRAEDKDHPLYAEAKALQGRILDKVPKESELCLGGYPVRPGMYRHPFMMSAGESAYPVSHYAFPLYASAGIPLKAKPFIECGAQKEYEKLITGAAGWSRNIAGLFTDLPFQEYAVYLTSIILVLESDDNVLGPRIKEQIAELFMRDFIMASSMSGLDKEDLRNNAFLGVVAKIINKYLNAMRDTEGLDDTLRGIWGDKLQQWERLNNVVTASIMNASSTSWQHNLPLMNPKPDPGDRMIGTLWKDHNRQGGRGGVFIWSEPHPHRFARPASEWYEVFPGWNRSDPLHAAAYLRSGDAQKYARSRFTRHRGFLSGYLDRELAAGNEDPDLQVEGAGLGLLFLRMLLTDMNPQQFPPPHLQRGYDGEFSVLPFAGVEPLYPPSVDYVSTVVLSSGKEGTPGKGPVAPDGVRIISLKGKNGQADRFMILYPDSEKVMHLRSALITNESGIRLSPKDTQWLRYDIEEIATTEDNHGEEIIVMAERAEKKGIAGLSCDHWLRISTWKVPDRDNEVTGAAENLSVWESSDRHCDNVKDLDVAMIDHDHIAVLSIDRNDHAILQVFQIDFRSKKISPVMKKRIVRTRLSDISLASAGGRIVLYTATEAKTPPRTYLSSGVFEDEEFHALAENTLEADSLFDMTLLTKPHLHKREDAPRTYAMTLGTKDGHLAISSWEIGIDGILHHKGSINLIRDQAQDLLLGSEADWTEGRILPTPLHRHSAFAIHGMGAVREVRDRNGTWHMSAHGIKVLHGHLLDDGRPTIEGSSLLPVDGSPVHTEDIAGNLMYRGRPAVITIHTTGDGKVNLVLWTFRDET